MKGPLDRLGGRLDRLARTALHTAHSVRDLGRGASAVPVAALRGVTGLLRRNARRWPDAPALRSLEADGRVLAFSWSELDAAVDRTAGWWRRRGIGRGDPVAVIMPNRAAAIVHQLGVVRLGGIAAPIGPERRGPPLAHVLRAVAPRAILVDDIGRQALDSLDGMLDAPILMCDAIDDTPGRVEEMRYGIPQGLSNGMHGMPDAIGDPLGALETTCLLLATSGTTGKPKAARLPHRRILMAGLAFHALGAHLRPDDVVFTPLPLSHASAQLAGLTTALWSGACLAIASRFSTRRYWADAIALGATVGLYVGEIGRYLADAPPDPDARRHAMHTLMGNGLAGDVWPRLQALSGVARIVEFYGATEGNTLLINATGKVGSVGRPVVPALTLPRFGGSGRRPDLCLARYDVARDVHLRDRRGRIVEAAVGAPGELLVRITTVNPIRRFDGYRDPEATAAKIVTDVRKAGDRWFRTGDLLRVDAEGDWFFVDRIGDTFRWKGHNVSTQAVAEALAPAIDGPFAVYGVALPHREGRAGMLAIAGEPDLVALFQRAQSLPSHARPLFIRRVDAIEHTGTQKVQKARLRVEGVQTDDAMWFMTPDGYVPWFDAIRDGIADGTLRL